MIRPLSIRRFEQLWWGATLLWLGGSVLSWQRTELTLAANPQTASAAGLALPVTVGVVLAATVLLWWLVARQASPVGKWLVAAVAALSGVEALARLGSILIGGAAHPASLLAFLAGEALTVAAAVMVFRPDTAEWFGLGEPEALS